MHSFLTFLLSTLGLPGACVLAAALTGLTSVFVLKHFTKNPQAAEHSFETALEHAVAVVEQIKAVAPAGVLLNDVELGLNTLDNYLKAHELGPAPDELKLKLQTALGK